MNEKGKSLKELEIEIQYNVYLIKSLEAKVERIDPLSVEFEETTDLIFKTKEEINTLAAERTLMRLRNKETI